MSGLEALGVVGELTAVKDAWQRLPRSLSVDSAPVPQVRVDLPEPAEPHASFESEALRRLGAHLHDRGLAGGSYAEDDAVRLESQTIFPFLKTLLLESCKSHDHKRLLIHAGAELECVARRRSGERMQLDANVKAMPVAYDPIERQMAIDSDASTLSRAIQLVIELLLISPPSGSGHVSSLDWRRTLSFATVAAASAIRGEAVQCKLQRAKVDVSDMGEVSFEETGPPMFDVTALHHAQAEAVRVGQAGADMAAVKTVVDKLDEGMLSTAGYRLTALLKVLAALRSYPTHDDVVGLANAVQLQEFIEKATELPSEEIKSALAGLTLRSEDLRVGTFEPWEFARRSVRLVTRPVVSLGDGTFMVLPWFLSQSLMTYTRYLNDARLPWPQDDNAPIVRQILDDERKRRNAALEEEVGHALHGAGFLVKVRVKKPSTIGLVTLSGGEIDAIAIDVSRSCIWVVEVKDPFEPFAPMEIARSIHRFHGREGWVAKLLKKVDDVSRDPMAVALALGVTTVQDWCVRGIVVTRRPVHAAFVAGSAVSFTTLPQCARALVVEG
jgi:hypothetical protein